MLIVLINIEALIKVFGTQFDGCWERGRGRKEGRERETKGGREGGEGRKREGRGEGGKGGGGILLFYIVIQKKRRYLPYFILS